MRCTRLRLLILEPPPELPHQRGLPDTGVADQGDHVRLALFDRVAEDRVQQLELRPAADERSRATAKAARAHQRQCSHEGLRNDGVGLAFRIELERGPELEGAAHRLGRPRTDDDRTGLCRLLEPGGDVDRVAGDERAADAPRPGDDLTRVHADPKREPSVEDGLEPLLHGERGVQCALGVVLERIRDAEDGHDGVAGELLDRPAGTPDLLRHRVVEAFEQHACPLGVLLVRERRRTDEVGEEHSGQLALGGLHVPIVTG